MCGFNTYVSPVLQDIILLLSVHFRSFQWWIRGAMQIRKYPSVLATESRLSIGTLLSNFMTCSNMYMWVQFEWLWNLYYKADLYVTFLFPTTFRQVLKSYPSCCITAGILASPICAVHFYSRLGRFGLTEVIVYIMRIFVAHCLVMKWCFIWKWWFKKSIPNIFSHRKTLQY